MRALFAWVLLLGVSYASLPADPHEYADWQNKMLQAITENKAKGDSQAMEKLARYVFQLSLPTNLEQGDRPVFYAAKEAVLATPNHGTYFSDALERALQAEFAEAQHVPNAVRVSPPRDQIYPTLVQLQSPEVVGLLGKLLYDERNPWKDEPKTDYNRPYTNSFYAVDTLNRVGLDGVKIIELKTDRDYEAALNQWKLWYEQVKAGTRTFRFKGNPQEYSLAGPVSEAREPKTTRPDLNTNSAPATPTETAKKTTGIPFWPLALAGGLLAVAAWFAMKRKPAAS